MGARFLVESTMVIEARSLFVLAGHILEGRVKPGMRVSMALDDDTIVDAEIHSIERVRVSHSAPTGLAIEYAGPDELSILKNLKLAGLVLEVGEAA